jgi:hypothetical protein
MENQYLVTLDKVLDLFRSGLFFDKNDILKELLLKQELPDLFSHNMDQVFDKLQKDGYLAFIKGTSKDDPDSYHITFEGQLFEGYLAQYRNKMENSNRIKNLENSTLENAKKLNTLTTWIAIGTIIAAVYYLIEIYNHFYPK